MNKIDYIKMAHTHLDEWIAGKINDGFWHYDSGILRLGKLKKTMEEARKQYLEEHPPTRYVTVAGSRYREEDVVKAIEQCGVEEPHE